MYGGIKLIKYYFTVSFSKIKGNRMCFARMINIVYIETNCYYDKAFSETVYDACPQLAEVATKEFVEVIVGLEIYEIPLIVTVIPLQFVASL